MSKQVYLALYKGKRDGKSFYSYYCRFCDWLTRKFTKGQYSHCEIAIENGNGQFNCYSSSVRDGGVRCKRMPLDSDKWDLVLLENVSENKIKTYFNLTAGKKYDWWGAIGIVLGIKHKRSKYFCSEWCFNAMYGSEEGWRFSPNDLAVVFKGGK